MVGRQSRWEAIYLIGPEEGRVLHSRRPRRRLTRPFPRHLQREGSQTKIRSTRIFPPMIAAQPRRASPRCSAGWLALSSGRL